MSPVDSDESVIDHVKKRSQLALKTEMADTLRIHTSNNSQNEYGLSACGFMNCMTPPPSAGASSISSRRGSIMSFSSSYSTSTSSTEYASPVSPTPISLEYQVEGLRIKSHNPDYLASAESYARRSMTPQNSTHSSLVDAFDPQALYLCPGSSVGGNFGIESSFTDLSTGWESQIFDQDASPTPSTPMETQEGYLLVSSLNPHFASQIAGDIQQEFPAMNGAYHNPPPTVLPSQTLKCPNPPESTLAMPFVSPVKTPAQLSPYSSPYLDEFPNSLKLEFAAETESASPCATFGSVTSSCEVLLCEDPALRLQRRQIVASYKRIASRKRTRQQCDGDDEDPGLVNISLARESVKKQYPCNICLKGFDRHEHLTRHNRTTVHINKCIEKGIDPPDPRPTLHKCPHCDKQFNRHDNLKPHKLTHYHDNETNNKNPSVSVEESEAMGEGKNDPRLNPSLGAKKGSNKKARTKKRA